jgi:hypothetical protein
MKKISIYVAYHKESYLVKSGIYIPIHVGSTLSNKILPRMIGDNTGDNISHLNNIYCEMTAAYWAWKNDIDSDFIGLCHYRRFFSFKKCRFDIRLYRYMKYIALKFIAFYKPGRGSIYWRTIDAKNEKQISTLCDNFSLMIREKLLLKNENIDIYAPKPVKFGAENIRLHFSMISGSYHIDLIKRIIKKHYPFLLPTLLKILNGNQMCYGNMFIMSRKVYNEYCNIMFDILEKHRQISITEKWCENELKEKCFDRLSGYISEIISATFIEYYRHNKSNSVKYITIINCKYL